MLYLAELNKPNFGRVTLQLLAKQVQQDTWQAVNEEAIPIEGKAAQDILRIKDGAMVLADVNNNRQPVQIREAAKQLVTYLQGMGRLQEKARAQEEEVESVKQALLYQQQILQTRELELAQREQELHQIAAEYEQYAEEIRQLDVRREEISRQEAYIAQQQNIIREQREQLQRQLEAAQKSRLQDSEAQELLALLAQIQEQAGSLPGLEGVTGGWQGWLERQQQYWQQQAAAVEQERQQAQARQNELDQTLQGLWKRRQEWLKARQTADNAWAELRIQEAVKRVRQEQIQRAINIIQAQEEMLRFTYGLVKTYDFIKADGVAAAMETPQVSVEDLARQVEDLRQQYQSYAQQVQQQAAELEQARQRLQELEAKLKTASPADRMDIEMDIDYEREACASLEAAVTPQMERLQRQHEELIRQEALLRKLKGEQGGATALPTVDVGTLIAQMELVREQEQALKERLEQQIQQADGVVRAQQEQVQRQRQEIEAQWQALEQEERSLREQLQGMAEVWGRLNFVAGLCASELEKLQPLWQQLQQLRELLGQQQGASQGIQGAAERIRRILTGLIQG
ncbi:MAG: pilus motility taxis protein HmpF [Thermostichales cyanobacterium SZTDM-1c_bins_54]